MRRISDVKMFSSLMSSFSLPTREIKWSAVATLVNSIVGVSVLAMPHCFMRCGVLLGTFLLLCSASLTILSCNQLFSAAASCTTIGILRGSIAPPSYQIVALRTLGPLAKLLTELAIFSLLFGIATSYFVLIGDIVPDLTRHLFLSNLSPEDADAYFPLWVNRLLILVPLTYGVALPLSLQTDFSGRTIFFVNATALTAYLLLGARIVLGALLLAPNTVLFSPSTMFTVNIVHPLGLLPSISIFILALSCQFQLLSLCAGEEPLSVADARLAAKVAVVLVTVLYWLIGVFGYMALLVLSSTSSPNVMSGDIFLALNQFGLADDALKFAFVMALVAGFPLILIPIRSCIYTMTMWCRPLASKQVIVASSSGENIGGGLTPSVQFTRYSTIMLITVNLVLAISFPDMEFVLELTGATAGITVCYILPSLMYAVASKRQFRLGLHGTDSPPSPFQQLRLYLAYAMTVFGFIFLFLAVFKPSVTLNSDDQELPGPSTKLPGSKTEMSFDTTIKSIYEQLEQTELSPPQIERNVINRSK